MQVYQISSQDKYGIIVQNVELDQCFDVFLTAEDFQEQYLDKSFRSYEFTVSQVKHGSLDHLTSEHYVMVSDTAYYCAGAIARFIRIEDLRNDAVAGLSGDAKVWPFDPIVGIGYDTVVQYNTYFKLMGVQYSAAKGGFVRSTPLAKKKLPVGAVNAIKRGFVDGGVLSMIRLAPGVSIEVDMLSNDQMNAGCLLMKRLGYTLDNIRLFDIGHGAASVPVAEAIAHVIKKEGLTDNHKEELTKVINAWWSDLK